jgi:hypothetical protein
MRVSDERLAEIDKMARSCAEIFPWDRIVDLAADLHDLRVSEAKMRAAIERLMEIAETYAMQTLDRSGTTKAALQDARAVLAETEG